MSKSKDKVHEFCAGGGCCPVLVQHPDRSLDIAEDGRTLTKLRPEDAEKFARVLIELGYGALK
jgi:hypothetical protein